MQFERDFLMVINGELRSACTTYDAVNPSTGDVIGKAPDASMVDLEAAISGARDAFPEWSSRDISERRDVLRAMAARIKANVPDLSRLLTIEQGKPQKQAVGEVLGCALWLEVIAEQQLPVTRIELPDRTAETHRVPLGVIGAITPWNYPLLLAIYKIAPALLAGNCVIVKPSPFTALCSLKMVELIHDLVPAGVLNIVSGGGELGAAISAHAKIDKISFTGSTATGKKIMQSASGTLKRLTLELGGNDAAIILPDVDVENVAKSVFWAAFFNSGQLCVAAKRIYVHEAIYDRFAAAMVQYATEVKMGDGLEQGTELGPINNVEQFARVKDLVEDCHRQGYKILTGGTAIEGKGYFMPVTIVDNPPEASRVVQEEAFGPIMPLLKVTSIDEAIDKANASDLGLGGSVWSADVEEARRVAARLQTANVWINENGTFHPSIPYGTAKQSGIGVENGIEGLIAYTHAKTVVVPK